MTRLVIATVILAIALFVTKRKLRRRPGAATLRVTSRTAISRGVIAAVLETEDRRFLVTISGTSTTVVAELGTVAGASTEPADFPASLAARLPDVASVPAPAPRPAATPTPVTTVATPAPAVAAAVTASAPTAATAPTAPARPTLRVPTFLEADAAVARASLPRRPAGQPSVIAAAGDDEAAAARRSLLDRARARTVRNYDVAELASTKPGA